MRSRPSPRSGTRLAAPGGVEEEVVVNAVVSGLRFLARHARDRAGAGGMATLRATIWPVSAQLPAYLFHNRGFSGPSLGCQQIETPPTAEAVFDIDDLAIDSSPLMPATYTLATGCSRSSAIRRLFSSSTTGRSGVGPGSTPGRGSSNRGPKPPGSRSATRSWRTEPSLSCRTAKTAARHAAADMSAGVAMMTS